MRVLMTGASSFTGMWLVLALAKRGVETVAALRGDPRRYDALRQARMAEVAAHAAVLPEAPMGSKALFEAAESLGPFDTLILHGAQVGSFRDIPYDAGRAVIANTAGLERLLVRMKRGGLRRVALTGSVFEAGEGKGACQGDARAAIGGYGFAKTMTSEIIQEACEREGIPLVKFVIASPFGAYAKPGFVAHLLQSWQAGETPLVRHPHLVRDWLPADCLAEAHADFIAAEGNVKGPIKRLTPSCFAMSNGAFAQMLAREMAPRLGLPCKVRLADPPEPVDEPVVRTGFSRIAAADDPIRLQTAFDRLVAWHESPARAGENSLIG